MSENGRKTLEDYTGPRDRGPKWRAPLRRPVRLHYLPSQDFEAVTENVSEGGMLIQSATILPVGTRLDFSITLADGSTQIRGFGEVQWLSLDENGTSTGMGVRFALLLDESSELLRHIVAEHHRSLSVAAFDLDMQ